MEIAKSLPVEVSKELVLRAFHDLASGHAVSQQQSADWLGTPEGHLWLVRTSLQAVGKQMTDADCAAVFEKMTPAQWAEFDDFQWEPWRNMLAEDQRMRSDFLRLMKRLRPAMEDAEAEAVFDWLKKGE